MRKTFATRAETLPEKQVLDLATVEADHGMHVAATRLTAEQLREAEAAFHRLEGRTRSLSFYLNYALTNYHDPAKDMTVEGAAKRYLEIREADHKQQNPSHRQFTSFRCELRVLQANLPQQERRGAAPRLLTDLFRRDAASKKTFNNRRGFVSA